MNRARAALIPALALLLLAGAGYPQSYGVELDVDGVLGNGPDQVSMSVSDYAEVDVWCVGTGPNLVAVGIIACPGPCLDFQSAVCTAPQPLSCGPATWHPCRFPIKAYDFALQGAPVPFLLGRITCHAAVDGCLESLTIDPGSRWINADTEAGLFDFFTGVDIQIGSTATEESSWGSVKGLFR